MATTEVATRSRSWQVQAAIAVGGLLSVLALIVYLGAPTDEFRYTSGATPGIDAGPTHGSYLAPLVSTRPLPRYEAWFTSSASAPSGIDTAGDPDDWRVVAGDLLADRGLDDEIRARFDALVHDSGLGITEDGSSWELAAVLLAIDAATAGDLTGGRVVAATGTVAADGTIGAVPAIDVKANDAARHGAQVLFAPAEVDHGDIVVVDVATVSDAVAWLCADSADDELCADS